MVPNAEHWIRLAVVCRRVQVKLIRCPNLFNLYAEIHILLVLPQICAFIWATFVCCMSVYAWAYFIVGIHQRFRGRVVTGKILTFADDTKLFRKAKEIGDTHKLQDDIDKLVKWSENGKCYSILGTVNVYTQTREILE